eukprot:3883309-Rhodomonas_salina.1
MENAKALKECRGEEEEEVTRRMGGRAPRKSTEGEGGLKMTPAEGWKSAEARGGDALTRRRSGTVQRRGRAPR